MAILIGESHQSGAAHARLYILFGKSGQFDLASEGIDHLLYFNNAKTKAGGTGHRLRISDGMFGRIFTWHGNRVHLLWAQGINSQGCHNGRIDAAR